MYKSLPKSWMLLSLLISACAPARSQTAQEPDPPLAVPTASHISLEQALASAIRQNPQVTQAKYNILSARENYNSQKSPINPTVQYAALNNTVAPIDFASGFGLRSNYSFYATLETNGALKYRASQAREQFHQAQFDATTTVLSLKLSVINAYIGLQVANKELEVELVVYNNMKQLSELTTKRFQAGAGTEADARRAQIAYVQERQNVIADVAAVNAARATLNAQLGRPAPTPVDVSDALVYAPTALKPLADLTKQAEASRPELKSAQANLRALKAVPGLERSNYYPNVVVGRDFGKDSTVNIGLSVPLDLGSIRGSVNKSRADIKAQEAQVELARQGIDLDVQTSYINLVAAQNQVNTYVGGILKDCEALFNQTRQAYTLGANTLLDVITAENTYRSVMSAYFNAVGSYNFAAFNLKHAVGELPDPVATNSVLGIDAADSSSQAGKRKKTP